MRITMFLFLILLLSCNQKPESYRRYIDLAGRWQFALDTGDVGIQDKWYAMELTDSIILPGTTDIGQKGFLNADTTTMHLNRVYKYEGPVWYRKKIIIPAEFREKQIKLILERSKSSTVWIDDQIIGKSRLLQTPQSFDVSDFLLPGEHTITIRIDNSLKLTPFGNVHIYSDDTQTNWNGIIGRIMLEASSKTNISDLQVYTDIDKQKIDIKLAIENPQGIRNLDIRIQVKRASNGQTKSLKTQTYSLPIDSVYNLEYILGKECLLWDDYQQPLYELTAVISNGNIKDSKTVTFGMRKFAAKGSQFTINNRVVFLRGKHEACVFPLTGHPPMDVEGWIKVFKIAKSYGINHYRFHSYCPPEAAFTAADLEGIYLQVETPFWGGLESDSVAEMIKDEGMAMLKNYANHPSFALFSHGNEIWSGHDRVEKNILAFKAYDNRPLYTMGSNNNIGYIGPRECSDFFVAARTPYAHDTILTHTRLTHAFADSKDGGILNTQTPSTETNFDFAVSQIRIPMISHEMGQYQIYPDYKEIEKYTGVLRAWNLEVFRERLNQSGMLDQNIDFQKASGAWSAICYKAEMEAALRTSGLAGFQLLDLQDFPGQGTALVGILDAFMDDKGVVDRRYWLQSCNDVVVLLRFPKYCWSNSENFQAKIQVVNFSNKIISDELNWEILDGKGALLKKGSIANLKISNTGINDLGEINESLTSIKNADQLRVNIQLKANGYSNTYPLWVYPSPNTVEPDNDILVTDKLDKNILDKLQQGKKILLFPSAETVKRNSVSGLFPPEFWNYGMFKGISESVKKPVSPGTLSILTNPEHPLFSSFPTEFHTNWQWFAIVKASNPLILNKTSAKYRPIVQIIDNLERNYKLGLIFEFKAGEGKLLVCMARLTEIMDKPEASQLYNSIINYMESDSFDPDYTMDGKLINEIFR